MSHKSSNKNRTSSTGKLDYNKGTEAGWDAETLFIDKMVVHIPLKLQLVCHNIAKRVGGNEFSIFCKIKSIQKDHVYLDEFYTIPEQIVTGVSIDYGKDPEEQVNVVIHRHPDGCNRFSGTDDTYINKNFTCSILFTRAAGFVYGIYNIPVGEDVKIQIPISTVIDDGMEEIGIDNIKERPSLITPYNFNARKYPYTEFAEDNAKITTYGKLPQVYNDSKEIYTGRDTIVTRGTSFAESLEEENKSAIGALRKKWKDEEKLDEALKIKGKGFYSE